MHFFTDPSFWAAWLRIVLIDILLAGDNAVVIALAVRSLPATEQRAGRIWGSLGAVALRLLFITLITLVLQVPLLRVVGALVLLWIAWRLVRSCGGEEGKVRAGSTLRQAIGIIILADVAMSLDNVLAIAAAAHGDLVLVAFGLLFSLPLVVWGSGLLAHLMNRWPVIVWLGGGVLGWVAIRLLLDDPWVAAWAPAAGPWLAHGAPAVAGAALFAAGAWAPRRGAPRHDDPGVLPARKEGGIFP